LGGRHAFSEGRRPFIAAGLFIAQTLTDQAAVKITKIQYDPPGSDTGTTSHLNMDFVVIKNTERAAGTTTEMTWSMVTATLAPRFAAALKRGRSDGSRNLTSRAAFTAYTTRSLEVAAGNYEESDNLQLEVEEWRPAEGVAFRRERRGRDPVLALDLSVSRTFFTPAGISAVSFKSPYSSSGRPRQEPGEDAQRWRKGRA
jgi:hypothetical protein